MLSFLITYFMNKQKIYNSPKTALLVTTLRYTPCFEYHSFSIGIIFLLSILCKTPRVCGPFIRKASSKRNLVQCVGNPYY